MSTDDSFTYPAVTANPQWITTQEGTTHLDITDNNGDPIPACPECSGVDLAAFRFAHAPGCELSRADDSRIAADHEQGKGVRPATVTEQAYAAAQGVVAGDDEQLWTTFMHGGIHSRVVHVEPADTTPRADMNRIINYLQARKENLND